MSINGFSLKLVGVCLFLTAALSGASTRTFDQCLNTANMVGCVTPHGFHIEMSPLLHSKQSRVEIQLQSIGRLGNMATISEGIVGWSHENFLEIQHDVVVERFSANEHGFRQDMIVNKRPNGWGQLYLTAKIRGMQVDQSATDSLTLYRPDGHRLDYSRLLVLDAQMRVLPSQFISHGQIVSVVVDDKEAIYPITIDPTISNTEWISVNPAMGGVDGAVNSIAIDSSGNLYAGGKFQVAGSVMANSVAKWDGKSWSPLGAGADGDVHAIIIDKNNRIFVGGSFELMGGDSISGLAMWNGTKWSKVWQSSLHNVSALNFDSQGNLYVGAYLTDAYSFKYASLGVWDGENIKALPGNFGARFDGIIRSVVVLENGNIYVGGEFTKVGTTAINGIAMWNGSTWNSVGGGIEGSVHSLTLDASGRLVAGINSSIGSSKIAVLDGDLWTTLGKEFSGFTSWLQLSRDGDLYASGRFYDPNSNERIQLKRWKNNSWELLAETAINGKDPIINQIAFKKTGELFVGGDFGFAKPNSMNLNNLGIWNGTNWIPLGRELDGEVNAITFDQKGKLYVGGQFSNIGGSEVKAIAVSDGNKWSSLGNGIKGTVHAITFDKNNDLYASGTIYSVEGMAVNGVVKWDGNSWTQVGPQSFGGVNFISCLGFGKDGLLYASGNFGGPDGNGIKYVAKWDGSKWSSLADANFDGSIVAMTFDSLGNLYVGGLFSKVNGISTGGLAKWDPVKQVWSSVGGGISGSVSELYTDDRGDLWVGGKVSLPGKTKTNLLRWDGNSWSTKSSFTSLEIRKILTDKSGNIYLGVNGITSGTYAGTNLLRFDGTNWNAIGKPSNNGINDMAWSPSGELYLAGSFTFGGGTISPYLAKLNPSGFTQDLKQTSLQFNANAWYSDGVVYYKNVHGKIGLYNLKGRRLYHTEVDGTGNISIPIDIGEKVVLKLESIQ